MKFHDQLYSSRLQYTTQDRKEKNHDFSGAIFGHSEFRVKKKRKSGIAKRAISL